MLSDRTVLKENELYWVGDAHYGVADGETGLYRRDTRYLSRYAWRLDGRPFQPLTQHLHYPWWLQAHSGNHNLGATMHTGVQRQLMLTGSEVIDDLRVTCYTERPRTLRLELAADFRDMFEVRGWPEVQARDVRVTADRGEVSFEYTAQDGLNIRALVRSEPPGAWDGRALTWNLTGDTNVHVTVHCLQGDETPTHTDPHALAADYDRWRSDTRLSDPRDREVLRHSEQDVRSLLFHTEHGPFPAAGIPWFVAPFGRDSLIIAHLLLDHHPHVALGVARYLAARQGTKHDPVTLEQPGKILHEERNGELTRTGRTQHRPYYGSVDATALFAWLCAELCLRDPALVPELRPHWQAALHWMRTDGDPDGDGLLEYTPDPDGIRNQVWKDSGDSTFDETGTMADGHIAIVEVQGYAYAAYARLAELHAQLGDSVRACELAEMAARLRRTFHERFWWPERGYYTHGLNGDKRPLRVLVSNPAHTLWTGIVPPEHAALVARTALGPELWSGWGIRTLGTNEANYNPVSYHNGSVWPHDTALAALGMERYGLLNEARQVARALFDAARWAPDHRLPELFAGFEREHGPPVPYPAACHPQGWDAVIPLALAHLLAEQEATARQPAAAGKK